MAKTERSIVPSSIEKVAHWPFLLPSHLAGEVMGSRCGEIMGIGGVENCPQTTGRPPPRTDVQCLARKPEPRVPEGAGPFPPPHPVQVERGRTSECGFQPGWPGHGGTGPRSQQALSLRETHASTAKNQECSAVDFLRYSDTSFFFFFLNLFLKKHTCAAVFVQRVRTQNKYMIGHSGRFTVSQA